MLTRMNARTVLWYVLFFGSLTQFAIRVNLNIAIVAMVAHRGPKTVGPVASVCVTHLVPQNSTLNFDSTVLNTSTIDQVQDNVFDWDEFHQGLLLGSFFWLTWASPMPSAILSRRFGGKVVLGVTHLAGVLLTFAMPFVAYLGFQPLLFIRFLQGVFLGGTPPAVHHMFGKWVPPDERGRFNASYLGVSLGIAIMYPLGGILIDWYGWESVFHVSGVMGLIWLIFYWFLVYDSPETHPRISNIEREYILNSLGSSSTNSEKLPTPWRQLLLSGPLWVNIVGHFGGLWGFYMSVTQAPTFLKRVLGFDIKIVGILSGAPQVARLIFGSVYNNYVAEHLLSTKKLSRKNVRKLSTFIYVIGQALLLVPLGFIGCDRTWAVFLVTAAMTVNGASFSGPLAGIIDLSPNFAGVSMGLFLSVCTLTGSITPIVVGALTVGNETINQWQVIWLLSAVIMIFCGMVYVIFVSVERQPWDNLTEKPVPEVSNLLTVDCPKMEHKNGSDEKIILPDSSLVPTN